SRMFKSAILPKSLTVTISRLASTILGFLQGNDLKQFQLPQHRPPEANALSPILTRLWREKFPEGTVTVIGMAVGDLPPVPLGFGCLGQSMPLRTVEPSLMRLKRPGLSLLALPLP